MKNLIALITILASFSAASIIDLDAQRKILNAKQNLEQISKNSTLTPELKTHLNQLRKDAIDLSEIVYSRKCNSVSINSIPDASCNNFIQEVKEFNNSYAKWTNSFFASRVTLMAQEKDFRKKIHTCVEMMGAFLNPNMTPEMLFPHELNVNITRRYETNVTISLNPQYNVHKWKFRGNTSGFNRNGEYKYLKDYFIPWTNMCRDLAIDNTGELDRRYIQAVKKYWNDSPYDFVSKTRGVYTGLFIHFKAPRAYVLEILVDGKVYKEVTVEYAADIREDVTEQPFMYLDNLPVNEIRLQLGGAAQHYISQWRMHIDGETSYATRRNQSPTISKTYEITLEGNVEVRVKN
jgi:hypothetical protein